AVLSADRPRRRFAILPPMADARTTDYAIAAALAPGGYLSEKQFDALRQELGNPPEAALRAQIEGRGLRIATPPRLPRWPSGVDERRLERVLEDLGCRHLVAFLIEREVDEFWVVDGLRYETASF